MKSAKRNEATQPPKLHFWQHNLPPFGHPINIRRNDSGVVVLFWCGPKSIELRMRHHPDDASADTASSKAYVRSRQQICYGSVIAFVRIQASQSIQGHWQVPTRHTLLAYSTEMS
jgi:hypothetical protein